MRWGCSTDPWRRPLSFGQPTPLLREFNRSPEVNEARRELSLSDIAGLLLRHKLLISGIVAIFTLAAILYSFIVTPVYRAEVLLAPVVSDAGSALNPVAERYLNLSGAGGVGAATQERAELLAALRSRRFTYAFIRNESLLPVLFPKRWDSGKQEWLKSAGQDTPTMWEAYERFDDAVRHVHLDEETGLITLSVEWVDPEVAATWANALVDRANEYLRKQAVAEGESSLEYLSQELRRTSADEIRDAVFRLVEMQMRNVMLANVREEFGFEILDPAVPPEVRSRPNRRAMAVAGFVLGGFVGVVVAAYREGRRRQTGLD
ncbi:MAG: hypothetical protein GF400_00945 [Candidatus Eisenbacteria bacterium]|nr:hypothetical protein [Candidatus Eisenbacteria bacterium]